MASRGLEFAELTAADLDRKLYECGASSSFSSASRSSEPAAREASAIRWACQALREPVVVTPVEDPPAQLPPREATPVQLPPEEATPEGATPEEARVPVLLLPPIRDE